jgi:2'-5' RNA ligase
MLVGLAAVAQGSDQFAISNKLLKAPASAPRRISLRGPFFSSESGKWRAQTGWKEKMHRLFVALRPPPAMRESLLALRMGLPGARWQDDAQLHLTLRFLGKIDRPQAEDVAAALGSVDGPAPEIALAGVGTFDDRGAVHTLWAGIVRNDALKSLHNRVERALHRVGVAPDPRAFHPHITVARFGRHAPDVAPFLASHAGLASGSTRVDHMLLYESLLGGEGAHYNAIARYPLTTGS